MHAKYKIRKWRKVLKIHHNLVWIKAQSTLIDELMADNKIAAMVVVRVADNLCGILSKDREKILKRLHALKHAPQEG